jgi:hypothetical protein
VERGFFRIRRRGPAWRAGDEDLVGDPVGIFVRPGVEILKRADAGRAVAALRHGGRTVVFKLFDESIPRRRLVRWFTGSAAARAEASGLRMARAGLPIPSLVATLSTSVTASALSSCLVTEWVEGERADRVWGRVRGRSRRRFLAAMAKRLRAMHERGLYAQDVGLVNWVVRPPAADGDWELVLVDLDRVRCYRRLSWARRRKNLVQIARSGGATADDCERFLFLALYLGDQTRRRLREVAADVARAQTKKEQIETSKRARRARSAERWRGGRKRDTRYRWSVFR